MRKVLMNTAETDSTWEVTEWKIKPLNITYAYADLKQVADNIIQMNSEERTLLVSLLEEFEDLFDGNLGDRATEPVHLDIKPAPKPFNSIYYPVLIINKETFQKELKRLV